MAVTWVDYLKAVAPGSIVFLAAYILMEESAAQYAVYAVAVALMVYCQIRLMPLGLSAAGKPKESADERVDSDDKSA
ncbi:hypothetical protein GYB62_02815 [bacterium]|nr:hypothetical protein [bacterium]